MRSNKWFTEFLYDDFKASNVNNLSEIFTRYMEIKYRDYRAYHRDFARFVKIRGNHILLGFDFEHTIRYRLNKSVVRYLIKHDCSILEMIKDGLKDGAELAKKMANHDLKVAIKNPSKNASLIRALKKELKAIEEMVWDDESELI